MESFKEVFAVDKYPLRIMSGKPQHIHIKDDAYHTPYMQPRHYRESLS